MASHKDETAPWRSAHQPRHARQTAVGFATALVSRDLATEGAVLAGDRVIAFRFPSPAEIHAADLLRDVNGLSFDLAVLAERLGRVDSERRARAEFDRLAERAPVRSLDLLRRNAS